MAWQHLREALGACALVAAAALPARADHCAEPCPPAPCAPQYRTVTVKEWVPEQYQATRTVYKTECKTETYTAYKTECVSEQRTRTVTINKMVPEVQNVTKTVYECVPTVEERTCYQTKVTCVPVTKTVRKCVDKGHWECKEVPCGPTLHDRMKKMRRKKDCCDPCADACCEEVRMKTVKVWVPCPTWVEENVTVMERRCEQVPVVTKVTVNKMVPKQVTCQVTVCKCVPETKTENYTVMVKKCVPYQATREVKVCVPTHESYTATRMVCRTSEKQVAVESCPTSCCDDGGRKHSRGRLLGKHRGGDCCE